MEKIRIGSIGVGRMGICHAESVAYRTPDADLVAVCDLNAELAEATAKRLGAEKFTTDYHEIMNDPNIDAVLITNTSAAHCECIKAACAAKKHIFCEKPTGINFEELNAIDEAVATNPGKVIQIGFLRRFDKSMLDAKNRVLRGEIGKVVKVKSVTRDPGKYREYFDKFLPGSGGIFYDMNVHDFDLCRWFAESEVKKVFSSGGVYAFDEFADFGDLDANSVTLQFENGVMGEAEGNRLAGCGYDVWVEIVGTKGSIDVKCGRNTFVVVKDENGIKEEGCPWYWERFGDAYTAEIVAFVDAIKNGKPSPCNTTDARRAVEIADIAKKSYEQGIAIENYHLGN